MLCRVLRRQPYSYRSVFNRSNRRAVVEPRNVNTFCAARKPIPDQIFEPVVLAPPAGSVLVPGCLVDQASGTGPKRFPLRFYGAVWLRAPIAAAMSSSNFTLNQRPVADNSTVTVATRTDNYRNVPSRRTAINTGVIPRSAGRNGCSVQVTAPPAARPAGCAQSAGTPRAARHRAHARAVRVRITASRFSRSARRRVHPRRLQRDMSNHGAPAAARSR
jgi:hypothetical protein